MGEKKAMQSRLVHVGVRATDLGRSLRFWRDALSLKVVAQGEGYFDLSDGAHNFRVFQYRGGARPANVSGLQDYLHIGVQVPDLQEALSRLLALGYKVEYDDVRVGKPFDPADPPTQSFKVADPDGIMVDVTASDDQWPGVGR